MTECSLPVEFVVMGVPASGQTRNKQRQRQWVDKVRAAGQAAVQAAGGGSPVHTEVEVTVTYYATGGGQPPDRDNMAKPMLDAMEAVVYVNDRQVLTMALNKRPLDGLYVIAGITPALASGFMANEPFVHIRVEANVDTGVLP